MSHRRSTCLAVLAAVTLLVPASVHAETPAARGLGVLQLSAAAGEPGARGLRLGAGLGLLDTGDLRLDLVAQLGIVGDVDASWVAWDGTPRTGEIAAQQTLLGLVVSRRIGRAELFAGVGYARARATAYYDVSCTWFDETFFPSSCTDGKKGVSEDGPRSAP